MAELIFFLIFLIPALLGVSEIIHLVRMSLYSLKGINSPYVVVWLKDDTAENQILSVCEQYSWSGKKYAQNIVAINSMLGDEKFEICSKMAEKNNIYFCSAEELVSVLNYLSVK